MELDMILISQGDRSKLTIMEAVDRPIDDISVREICEKAGISRQGFYKHFDSKYDIGIWYWGFCLKTYLAEGGRSLSWHDAIDRFIVLSDREADAWRYIVNANIHDELLLRERIVKMHRDEMEATVTMHGVAIDADLAFSIESYCRIFNTLMNHRYQGGGVLAGGTASYPDDAPSRYDDANALARYLESILPKRVAELGLLEAVQ